MISGLPSVSKLIFTTSGKWTLIFSFSGTDILNNLSSPVERGLAGTVAQEEIPNKKAPGGEKSWQDTLTFKSANEKLRNQRRSVDFSRIT